MRKKRFCRKTLLRKVLRKLRQSPKKTLADIIDWAINLATQQNPQPLRRRRQRHTTRSPVEPPPVIPNPDIRRVQVNPAQPRNPSLYAHYDPPEEQRPFTSSDEDERLRTQANPFRCHYPHEIYVAEHLPTRTPSELRDFKNYCHSIYSEQNQSVELHQPLSNAQRITPNPLIFVNDLWRSKTTLTFYGIFEEYQWIRRHSRQGRPRPRLEPAYKVFYPWNGDGWTVSRLINDSP